jgi:SAM-dependent methyltransferase
MLSFLSRFVRELNWSRRKWSAASDREFHDELYRSDDYDPFSLAYPGDTTIRRFADLVEPALPAAGKVVDLGCGPGEITCELAARRPDLSFFGVDHSAAAVAKAHANKSRRGVSNVQFECRDVESYTPLNHIDLVTLFDAFHHLTQPAAFVNRLGPSVGRWALIEPRGSWAGTWQKDLDFDWVAHDLDKIRAHIASAFAVAPHAPLARHASASAANAATADKPLASASAASAATADKPRQAIERRYTLDDLQRFFAGYTLDLRGTVAGLESYPPAPNQHGELRERFGELRYELFRDLDEWLFTRNLDLHAKHWLVIAERPETPGQGEPTERSGRWKTRRASDLSALSALPSPAADFPPVAGPYDVKYGAYRGPRDAGAGQRVIGAVALTNEGWETWSSDRERGIFTSYHWLSAKRQIVTFDGERTPLPRALAPGETEEVAITIIAPATSGKYRLAIDLVREGVTWFSQAGRPWLEIPFDIR